MKTQNPSKDVCTFGANAYAVKSSLEGRPQNITLNKKAATAIQQMLPVQIIDNLITKEQLAKHLNLSISMINKLMVQGLPRVKIGRSVRFKVERVMPWIDRRS